MQAAATLIFGLLTNIHALVASRRFQGLSAANIYTGGFALLVDTVGHDEIGKWMGFVLSFANAGILVSPLLGGMINGKLGYIAISFIMLGVVIFDILLWFAMVEKNISEISRKSSDRDNDHSRQQRRLPHNSMNEASEENSLLASSRMIARGCQSRALKRRCQHW